MTAIEKINQLVSEYNFSFEAMLDVNHRIECCQDEAYLQQQLRYLKNLINKDLATKKTSSANEVKKIYHSERITRKLL